MIISRIFLNCGPALYINTNTFVDTWYLVHYVPFHVFLLKVRKYWKKTAPISVYTAGEGAPAVGLPIHVHKYPYNLHKEYQGYLNHA